MRTLKPLFSTAMMVVLAGALLACIKTTQGGSGGSGGATETGGQTGSGATTGSGGSASSGGMTGTGGTTGSGGSASLGGSAGSLGGASGIGGATATGGAVSTGGMAGTGGSSGSNRSGGSTGSGGGNATGGSTGGRGGGVTGGTTGQGGMAGSATGKGGMAGGNSGAGGATGSGGAAGSTGVGGSAGAGGTSSTLACADTSTTALSFTKQYQDGEIAVTGSTKTYHAMTNWWHTGTYKNQSVAIKGLSMTVGNSGGASVPASDGSPLGFPSIFIGSYSGHATVGSNLPKKVSDIKSVPTIFSTNASSLDTSNMNATYDVWFTASGTALGSMSSSPGAGGAYLMVWLYKPADRQPRGGTGEATGASPNHPGQTVSGVPGTWDVWVDSSDPPCISYVSSTPIDELTFDLNNFIQDSVTQKYGVTSSMYLSIVFAGFEIWSGGDGLTTKQFCAAVN